MILDDVDPVVDGICFDDLFGVPPDWQRLLLARGLVYATEFLVSRPDGSVVACGGQIVAASYEKADEIAFGRGLDETVIGMVMLQ